MRHVSRAMLCVFVLALIVSVPSVALAFDEPELVGEPYAHPVPSPFNYENCGVCHSGNPDIFTIGPPAVHGAYSAATNKCAMCHTVHNAPEDGRSLLPGPTITAACFTCHDGTGGRGVYGTIQARVPGAQPSGHRTEMTDQVPGGDAMNGGMSTMVFAGLNNALTCTDCHSAHGSETVQPFLGDRARSYAQANPYYSSKLLLRNPGGSTIDAEYYGSDWCLGCHAGRGSAGMVMNHPVDSVDTHVDPFNYGRVALVAESGVATGTTVIGGMGGVRAPVAAPPEVVAGGNRGYLMPYPRTPGQDGHAPICQQCHEDSRAVGSLVGDGSLANVTAARLQRVDGDDPLDNPRFQNFPHETENFRMLVTADEDDYTDQLCMNCHPPSALP